MEIVPELSVQEEEIPAPEEPEKDINAERLEKRYGKVASLMEKWVETEKYTTPGINIKDVATQMGTNSNYLSTYINNVLGTSFALWLNTLRVEKSKEYLASQGRISMEECGIKVGYESLYNYSRWFKTVTGMSPSQWKRSN
jgi:YesN/AraC family two-component response regulator